MLSSRKKKYVRNLTKRREPRFAFHATVLLLALGLASSGLEVHAAAPASNLAQKTREFVKKHPEADANNDGTLTPSELWLFRSKTRKDGGNQRAIKDTDALIKAGYTPTPIDENKTYGPAPGKKIKLFILSGQSNMAGQGLSAELPPEMLRPNNRLLMFAKGKWQPLRPLRYTFGPEIAFGHAMAKAWPDETIGIVKQARGGTGILAWHPDWTAEKADLTGDARKGNLWKELTDKVRDARNAADCEIMAFVWQQGGKDMQKLETGKQYLSNLRALIEGLRKETGVPDLPLVLGSYRQEGIPDDLSNFVPEKYTDRGRPGAPYVLKAQFDAQKELAPAKMIPLRELERHPENVHYNTNGQLELGRLLAEGFLELAGR